MPTALGGQAYNLRKQLQELKTDVALFSEKTFETSYEVLHSTLSIFIGLTTKMGIRAELPLQLKKASLICM
jgi:hypothetical protein